MFKSLNKEISTPVAIITIIVCAILVGGIIAWQYLEISKEGKEIPEIKPIEELTNAFLAGSGNDSAVAILYNRIEKKITHEKIINLNGLELGTSGFKGWGNNDSVQYNTATNQILLFVNNVSLYDGSFLTDAPYSEAIWITSFGKDIPEVFFIPEGHILSWITHPDKPMVYVAHQIPATSDEEILEINLLNKGVRRIANIGSIAQSNHLELVISKDGNSIFQAVRLHDRSKVLLKQINLANGTITVIDLEDRSDSFDTDNLSPDEKAFVFFGGWLGESGLRIRYLKEQKTEILPLPEDLEVANFNLWWSGDNNKLMFLLKADSSSVPFIYSISDKNGGKINTLIGQFPLIWSPVINYIFFEEGSLQWNIFDLKTYEVENIYSSSSLYTTVGARWVK